MDIGFLHPGLMGETLAANCAEPTVWVSEGRSEQTRARAAANGMDEVASLSEMCGRCGVVVSICPPGAAVEVAQSVAATGFSGTYVDANAISPDTAASINALFDNYVDGSVIGPPAHKAGTTRLYLSGPQAGDVAALYDASLIEAMVLNDSSSAASAIKMAYASWTKIGSALHLAIRAFAANEGVDEALVEEWNRSQPGLADRSERIAAGVSPKAWRFTGEMEHIAAAFADSGLPDGFAQAALEVYNRLAHFKGATGTTLADVTETLRA